MNCAECDAPCGGKACRHEVIDASNVAMAQAGAIGGFYFRPMELPAGGTHEGHAHWIDHVSIVTRAASPLRIEWSNPDTGESGTTDVFEPCKLLIKANVWHKFTAIGTPAKWECVFAEVHNTGGKPVRFHQERPSG